MLYFPYPSGLGRAMIELGGESHGWVDGPARPYPRERDVTICIAASCEARKESQRKIILCSDTKQSSSIGAAEILVKHAELTAGWHCLSSGNTLEINMVVKKLRALFGEASQVDESNVCPLVEEALRWCLHKKRDELAHSLYSRGYEDLMATGKTILPADNFARFAQKIEAVSLEAEFVIAGFAGSDDFLIETTRTGAVRTPTHFACVGEGEYLARASLLQREYMFTCEQDEALYYVYEAKKHAERVNSVGPMTIVQLLHMDGSLKMMKLDHSGVFDDLYRRFGPQRIGKFDLPADLFHED